MTAYDKIQAEIRDAVVNGRAKINQLAAEREVERVRRQQEEKEQRDREILPWLEVVPGAIRRAAEKGETNFVMDHLPSVHFSRRTDTISVLTAKSIYATGLMADLVSRLTRMGLKAVPFVEQEYDYEHYGLEISFA